MRRILLPWPCRVLLAAVLVFAAAAPAQEPGGEAQEAQEPGGETPAPEAGRGQAEEPLPQELDPEEASSALEVLSSDGRLRLRFRGKIQNDWAFFSADQDVEDMTGPFQDGTEFRRARFNLSGEYEDWFAFKWGYDFSDGTAGIRDAYAQFEDVPVVDSLRVGHFKEPFGLENRTSSNYLTFLERSLANALVPGRNLGFMAYDTAAGKRMTWAAGLFRDTDSSAFGADEGSGKEFAGTTRVTWIPWYEDDGRRLLHLGLAGSLRNPDQGEARFRSRPESDLAPRIVDTGTFPAGEVRLGGLEAAVVLGPLSLQGEFIHAWALSSGSWQRFQGYYFQGSWFLTGEYRPYSRKKGSFGRVSPLGAIGEGGPGALELTGRYSRLDLRESLVYGGSVQDLTVGLNWYLTERLHVQLNYVLSDLETFGNAQILQARFHFDW